MASSKAIMWGVTLDNLESIYFSICKSTRMLKMPRSKTPNLKLRPRKKKRMPYKLVNNENILLRYDLISLTNR